MCIEIQNSCNIIFICIFFCTINFCICICVWLNGKRRDQWENFKSNKSRMASSDETNFALHPSPLQFIVILFFNPHPSLSHSAKTHQPHSLSPSFCVFVWPPMMMPKSSSDISRHSKSSIMSLASHTKLFFLMLVLNLMGWKSSHASHFLSFFIFPPHFSHSLLMIRFGCWQLCQFLLAHPKCLTRILNFTTNTNTKYKIPMWKAQTQSSRYSMYFYRKNNFCLQLVVNPSTLHNPKI